MYVPAHFSITDPAEIDAFIRAHAFAALVSGDADGRLIATHLPLEAVRAADGVLTLTGHMARANPQWRTFQAEAEVLAVFGGPHAYISPRWYDTGPEGHGSESRVNVPTWNYQAVHAYGQPRLITEHGELFSLLKGLVDRYEADAPDDSRYRLEGLPADFVEKQMRGVVGFQIRVTRLEAKYKLSQNRDARDYDNVVAALTRREDERSRQVAGAMRRHRPARYAKGFGNDKPNPASGTG
jgi:transcriptional regulator